MAKKISQLPSAPQANTSDQFIVNQTGVSRALTVAQVLALVSSGGGGTGGNLDTATGTTLDTGETFRLVMLSDGEVHAIPNSAVPPLAPTGLTPTVRLTSVNLHWDVAAAAVSYNIIRNGTLLSTTTQQSFRDVSVTIGQTYSYAVASVDQYQQRSPASASVIAFIDPALNSAPTDVVITVWPTPLPTDGPAYVRVNAREVDVQNISYTLGVDAGNLTSTADPSVWIIRV